MDLVRLGGSPFRKAHDAVQPDKENFTVGLIFRRPENTSDFRVDLTWEDVEKLVVEFAAMKEPKAIFLRQANNLAIRVCPERSCWIA